ncbi:uncharacterized protein TRIADDRAFT_61593 [Trichoplax adhaerens]|uniref:CCDC81 HU domain-containing protein n=1 Tax=Trichoplax adhaerens TaxID=10228 RepID=B3SBF1_TRIAD|nr:hypothetical protein TRIADDRAFT_61593 [Trichoplax adhaerens]EDV19943.1 hypothetical protein TRIADDRAFT_61593 [Trichoplax adhaerens]|eukprot:XP_002117533.1 hypothetical protein TRIADDRAFT_61593 [Trichoplax adhaerens]
MNGLIDEAKKNRFSTIPDLSTNDVLDIWDNISRFVEQQMLLQKGVSIPGLGTFTFSQKKLDMGGNKYILFQRPIFTISEKFAQSHGIAFTKTYTPGEIPVISLNLSYLSNESPFNRDTIEACVKEVLMALSKSVRANRNIEFTFTGVGRLCIRSKKVKMKFFKEFINCMDGSGHLAQALSNRPFTADSVISPTKRPGTGNTVILPRLNTPVDKDALAPETSRLTPISRRSVTSLGHVSDGRKSMPIIQEDMEEFKLNDEENLKHDNKSNVLRESEIHGNSDQKLSFKNSPEEMIENQLSPIKRDTLLTPNNSRAPSRQQSLSPREQLSPSRRTSNASRLSVEKPSGSRSPSTARTHVDNQKPSEDSTGKLQTEFGEKNAVAAGKVLLCPHHGQAGQELCYLCHQREAKNVQISYAKEKAQMDRDYDTILQKYQQQQDAERITKELAKDKAYRDYIKQLSEYNLKAADVKKKALKENASGTPKMILNRAVTPLPYEKQKQYHSMLDQQVQEKREKGKILMKEKEFLEKLEQAQLAEDIKREEEHKATQRKQNLENYATCLKTQMANKNPELPANYPNSLTPVFGTDAERLNLAAKRRRRAHEIYKEQLASIEQAKRDKILQKLQREKEEMDSIQKAKADLKEELVHRYIHSTEARDRLEKEWQQQAAHKKINDREATRIPSPDELLLTQCDKYTRCLQCQRKPTNNGKSNFFKDTVFMSGTRYIV